MTTKRGAEKYLASLEAALLLGKGWRNPQLYEDVLKIAHLLRCLKLCRKLAKSYLCIRHPTQKVHVVVRVKDAPHSNIRKLHKEEAIDYFEAVQRALVGVNAELTHVTFVKFEEGHCLELLVYFEAATKKLMQEQKCTYSQVPETTAKAVKAAGESASKGDLTKVMHVARKKPIVEELLARTAGRRPAIEEVASFLALTGQPVTEDSVEDLMVDCIETLSNRSVESVRGSSSESTCQNPSCSADIRGKRKICGRCQRAAYCSDVCQKADRERHARGCSDAVAAVFKSQDYLRDEAEYSEAYKSGCIFA